MIISPISYPGNKSKILKQLIPELDTNVKLVDVLLEAVLLLLIQISNLYCNDISRPAWNY